MSNLADYSTTKPIKMLLIGDSGNGKTGALASLAAMGFNIRILDYDNGLGILPSVLKKMVAENKAPANVMERITYESCLDNFKELGGKILPVGIPSAFPNGLKMLNKWKGKDGIDLGAVSSWGKDTILVIDSLSHMANSALVYVLGINNRSGEHPWQSDWGVAMDMVEGMLKILYSDAIKCHIIVNAHITTVGEEYDDKGKKTKEGKQFPNALGQKLPPKIGQYFNTMLKVDKEGTGSLMKRIIRTVPNDDLGIKCEILGLAKTLPLESGLADFFKAAGQLPTNT